MYCTDTVSVVIGDYQGQFADASCGNPILRHSKLERFMQLCRIYRHAFRLRPREVYTV